MTRTALEARVMELEAENAMLRILLEEAQVLAEAERRAADLMEARVASYLAGGQAWAAQA